MKISALYRQILQKQSFLCVGLDSDILKIPDFLKSEAEPVFEFNKRIVDATADYAVAYKPNTAFYEALGADGWRSLQKTAEYIKTHYPEIYLIADAKRGDIGNTSKLYARAFFEQMPFDAVTVAPYMGSDSVKPFLEFPDKQVILLALTSNNGSADFQKIKDSDNTALYQSVIRKSLAWADEEQLMYVVGATRTEDIADIREIVPEHFLLVPGVGAQGGDLQAVLKHGLNRRGGLLINSSRGIIFADNSRSFELAARTEAQKLRTQMIHAAGNFFS